MTGSLHPAFKNAAPVDLNRVLKRSSVRMQNRVETGRGSDNFLDEAYIERLGIGGRISSWREIAAETIENGVTP